VIVGIGASLSQAISIGRSNLNSKTRIMSGVHSIQISQVPGQLGASTFQPAQEGIAGVAQEPPDPAR